MTPDQLITSTLELDYFVGDRPAVPVRYQPGIGKLVLCLGPNASGKSFFRRCLQQIANLDYKLPTMHLSMDGRSESGIKRAFIYGSEQHNSTGHNSARTFLTSIKTSHKWGPHLLFWDEPDIGLSDEHAAHLGLTLADFIRDPPESLKLACLVTHSRVLLRHIPLGTGILWFGTNSYDSLASWLDREIIPQPLETLQQAGTDQFRQIQQILNRRKAERDAEKASR